MLLFVSHKIIDDKNKILSLAKNTDKKNKPYLDIFSNTIKKYNYLYNKNYERKINIYVKR